MRWETTMSRLCETFNRYGNYFPTVANYLINIGVIEGKKLKEDRDSLDDKMLEGIITLVLWKLFEKEKDNG